MNEFSQHKGEYLIFERVTQLNGRVTSFTYLLLIVTLLIAKDSAPVSISVHLHMLPSRLKIRPFSCYSVNDITFTSNCVTYLS